VIGLKMYCQNLVKIITVLDRNTLLLWKLYNSVYVQIADKCQAYNISCIVNETTSLQMLHYCKWHAILQVYV